eukprot:scaffold70581_cov31-Tisochrysis_lutea.AAC.2
MAGTSSRWAASLLRDAHEASVRQKKLLNNLAVSPGPLLAPSLDSDAGVWRGTWPSALSFRGVFRIVYTLWWPPLRTGCVCQVFGGGCRVLPRASTRRALAPVF